MSFQRDLPPNAAGPARGHVAWLRAMLCLAGAALLSACAATTPHAPQMTATQEAATYIARAKPTYAPPGPPTDPWGPYITEASRRFDVPEAWVRQVIRVESGGYEYRANGTLVTSPVGAMGLMQLMPETYDEMRARYALGDDAFNPHDNILAGTAYLREMYDNFGSPGFLAAYNGGPARLQDYLVHNRPLPAETRRYVAMIAPVIAGVWPQNRSPAEQLAVNQLPMIIPDGPRYGRHRPDRRHATSPVRLARAERRHGHHTAPVEVAEAPAWAVPVSATSHHGGIQIIGSAMASEGLVPSGGQFDWGIQVGAYGRASEAEAAAAHARGSAFHARPVIAMVKSGHNTLYRARLSGLSHEGALQACRKLAHAKAGCIVVSPAAS